MADEEWTSEKLRHAALTLAKVCGMRAEVLEHFNNDPEPDEQKRWWNALYEWDCLPVEGDWRKLTDEEINMVSRGNPCVFGCVLSADNMAELMKNPHVAAEVARRAAELERYLPKERYDA